MNNYIVKRKTANGTVQTRCKNMREAKTLFDEVKDHVSTSQTQLLSYGKVVRTHNSEQNTITPLQNMGEKKDI